MKTSMLLLIVLNLISIKNISAQQNNYNTFTEIHKLTITDTVIVPDWAWIDNRYTRFSLSCDNTTKPKTYVVNGKNVDSTFFEYIKNLNSEVFHYHDSAAWHYCKFIGSSGQVSQEGIWSDEAWFIGTFKSYYENGKVKEEGAYSDKLIERGNKIGTWKYYNELGQLVRTEDYNNQGILIKGKYITKD